MRQWSLVGNFGAAGDSRSKAIEPVPFRVGRRPDASLTLPRATVSGLHAELFLVDDRLFVRDLNSTNGTFINGERIVVETELRDDDVIQFADVNFRVASKLPDTGSCTMMANFDDHALARVQFQKLMRDEIVTPYFQPIVDLRTGAVVAFEVLARSRLIGLETPGRMFAAAADLQNEAALSELLRRKGLEISQQFAAIPHVFLNTHPVEFADPDSWDWVARLRELAPSQRLTIEIHEAAITDVIGLARFRALLRDYDIGLAFDDFGAGQARIAELADVRPDCLKFDRRIITGLDLADATRRRFVRTLIEAVRDMGVVPLAEGVETVGEQAVCRELGFELGQGFFLGLPAPIEAYLAQQPGAGADTSLKLPHVPLEAAAVPCAQPAGT